MENTNFIKEQRTFAGVEYFKVSAGHVNTEPFINHVDMFYLPLNGSFYHTENDLVKAIIILTAFSTDK